MPTNSGVETSARGTSRRGDSGAGIGRWFWRGGRLVGGLLPGCCIRFDDLNRLNLNHLSGLLPLTCAAGAEQQACDNQQATDWWTRCKEVI
jgi:hypothetical protein